MKKITNTLKILLSLALLGLILSPFPRAVAQTQVTQGEWAAYLARGIGLEKNLPPETTPDRYLSILASKGYRRVEGEDFEEASPSMSVETATTYGLPSQKKWMQAGQETGRLKYRFETPVARSYTLRARVRGEIQFWSIDGKGSVLVTPNQKLEWIEVGTFNFKAGEHEIAVSVPPGGGVDVFELLTETTPAIEPPGGFQPLEPLTFGDKAATIVRALNLEEELPVDEGFYLIIEAERYDQAEGQFQISEDQQPGRASERKWLKAEGETGTQYSFEVPEKGMYSILARGFGYFEETWNIDQGAEKLVLKPHLRDKFGWFPVTTLLLEAGPHVIAVELKSGNGSDVIMIVRRRAGQVNYLQLLSDLGLQEGALPGKGIHEEKRRYELYLKLEAEDYLEVVGKASKSTEERYGLPSDQEWLEPREKEVVSRYEVELKEDGIYALYMRAFGPDPITWMIDPRQEKFREQRRLFPRAEDEFLWQEVVTLELARGKHVFEVKLPQTDGLDVLELRKRSWTMEKLDVLSDEIVVREEALRNLEEVGKLFPREEEEEEEEEEEIIPGPPLPPPPTPYYVPLSPYIRRLREK